jgi:formylglycine-generating enzyme required for sulfatase activity
MPTPRYTFFIAHAGADTDHARELHGLLHPAVPCFLDVADLEPGEAWDAALREAQAASRATVVLISPPAARRPHYRDAEIADAIAFWRANEATHRVIPVYLDGRPSDPTQVPYGLTNIHDLDAKALGFPGLASALRSLASKLDGSIVVTPPTSENRLRRLYQQRAEARAGRDDARLTALDAEIVAIKREQRAAGQLQAGDFLGDGRYELLERRGKGGFATVWKAWDDRSQRFVAVKVLHAEQADDRSRRERFFRGARQMAGLDHPGIVRVLEPHGIDDGWHYFVMEFIEGEDLDKAVRGGRVGAERGLVIVLEVAEALQFAHERKLVHRDVTPSNILLDRAGRPHLTDFDLVQAADTTGGTRTSAMGKWVFAPPEMMKRPQDADARSDVYSLAMTLAFIYAGGQLDDDVMYEQEAYLAALPCEPHVRAALAAALKRRMNERLASVAEFVRALRTPTPSVAVPAPSAPTPGASGKKAHPAPGGSAMRGVGSRPGEVWVEPATGIAFVWIPPGEFRMGVRLGVPVTLPTGFWIGQHPVTNEAYGRFLAAAGRREPESWRFNKPDQPVVGVDFRDALAFCAWATHAAAFDDEREITLPTEAEWEYVARAAGGDGQLREYPWGHEPPTPERAVFYPSPSTAPVGGRPAGGTPLGVHDLVGNVSEWCLDVWKADPAGEPGPLGWERPKSAAPRAVRGGSWWLSSGSLRATVRGATEAGHRDENLGFRVVCRGSRQIA